MTIGSTTDFEIPINTALYPTSSITKAVLMRTGAVTHSFDMEQRYIQLTINSRNTTSVFVRPPANATIAPPGYYMLFVSVGTGSLEIPSWGEFVKLI